MQLNISSDYAIRAMLFLSLAERRANAAEISKAMSVPVNTCKRNLQLLKNAGLVTPYPGVSGGYTLAKKPEEISLADILRAVGEKLEVNRCVEDDAFCNRLATETCPVRRVYVGLQQALDTALSTTLRQLLDGDG